MTTTAKRVNDAWTDYDVPWVEEIPGEPFSYMVQSTETASTWYKVDLTQRGGHGACSCVFFQVVAAPNWRRLQQWIPYAPKRKGCTECKHIRAAWDYWHLSTAVPMMAKFKNGIPNPWPNT